MGRAVRAGLGVVAAVGSGYLYLAGIVGVSIAAPATDIDGPVPWTNRVLWVSIGAGISLVGGTLLFLVVWRLVRRRIPASVIACWVLGVGAAFNASLISVGGAELATQFRIAVGATAAFLLVSIVLWWRSRSPGPQLGLEAPSGE